MSHYKCSLENIDFSNVSIDDFDNPLMDNAHFEIGEKSSALSVSELVELFLEYRERMGRKRAKRNG